MSKPVLLVAAVVTLVATPVVAHISLENRQAAIGASYKAVFTVPHGCAGSPTVKIRVQIPEGVIAVKPMPKTGWSLEIVSGKYSGEYEYHGKKFSEGVKEVVWSGGKLPDGNYDEFVVSTFLTAGSEAKHHAVLPGGAGMRAGGQPLDRYSCGRPRRPFPRQQIAGTGRQAAAETVRDSRCASSPVSPRCFGFWVLRPARPLMPC